MPPKGALDPPHKLGFVVQHGEAYRMQLSAMPDLATFRATRGPVRKGLQAEEKAYEDLANARTCETRKGMLVYVRKLQTDAALATSGSADPANGDSGVGQPAVGVQAVALSATASSSGAVSHSVSTPALIAITPASIRLAAKWCLLKMLETEPQSDVVMGCSMPHEISRSVSSSLLAQAGWPLIALYEHIQPWLPAAAAARHCG